MEEGSSNYLKRDWFTMANSMREGEKETEKSATWTINSAFKEDSEIHSPLMESWSLTISAIPLNLIPLSWRTFQIIKLQFSMEMEEPLKVLSIGSRLLPKERERPTSQMDHIMKEIGTTDKCMEREHSIGRMLQAITEIISMDVNMVRELSHSPRKNIMRASGLTVNKTEREPYSIPQTTSWRKDCGKMEYSTNQKMTENMVL